MSHSCGGALPEAGGSTTADISRTQGSSAQVCTARCPQVGEGWGPGGRRLSPEGEMPKGPENEASSHVACLSSRREDEVLSLPPAAAADLVVSSQQCFLAEPIFTVFLESRALSSYIQKF